MAGMLEPNRRARRAARSESSSGVVPDEAAVDEHAGARRARLDEERAGRRAGLGARPRPVARSGAARASWTETVAAGTRASSEHAPRLGA